MPADRKAMSRYSIIFVDDPLKYREVILGIWERNLSYKRRPERFAWLYEKNPCGRVFTWLARHEESGQYVGCGSVYPWPFYVNEREVVAGVSTDYGVDLKHRVFGPALAIQKAITSSFELTGYNLLFVYPDKVSSGLFQRAGYELIGTSLGWVKLLRSENYMSKRIGKGHVTRIAGSFIDQMLAARDWVRICGRDAGLTVQILDQCDGRFDSLWAEVRGRFPVIPSQESTILNWRYAECVTEAYRFFCLFNRDGALKGFLIFSVKDREATIKDIVPASGEHVAQLLVEFAIWVRGQQVQQITVCYFGDPDFSKLLDRFGYYQRPIKRDYYICINKDVDPSLRQILLNRENYRFFFG
jgi:hypothetical protein